MDVFLALTWTVIFVWGLGYLNDTRKNSIRPNSYGLMIGFGILMLVLCWVVVI